jgi:hypothetical protein
MTFRRDRHGRGCGVFICVKNNIACSTVRLDDDFEIIAVEVKCSDPKCTWKVRDIKLKGWLAEPVFLEILQSGAL